MTHDKFLRYSFRKLKWNLFTACSLFMLMGAAPFLKLHAYEFRNTSALADGRWVKVETPVTGLYSITYDQLLEMGFGEPARVGVYGKGGGMMSMNFIGSDAGEKYSDDLSPVAVIHDSGRLLFYARGVDNIRFRPADSDGGPRFERQPFNIYSASGYYFLTDKDAAPLTVGESAATETAADMGYGYGYLYHERDLEQNTTGTGQLFWGENLADASSPFSVSVNAPYMTGTGLRLEVSHCLAPKGSAQLMAEVNGQQLAPVRLSNSSTAKFSPTISLWTGDVPESGSLDISVKGTGLTGSFLYLDWLLATYTKSLPVSKSLQAAEIYGLPTSAGVAYSIPVPQGLAALDVSDPSKPLAAKRSSDRKRLLLHSVGKGMTMLIYNPAADQNRIANWSPVKNSNLHSWKERGADMLIITIERFRPYAEQIAAIHREADGMETLVATAGEIYNEFSGGVPDAMAYRGLAKMLHESPGRSLRNVLLLGPSTGDYRNGPEGEHFEERLIAFQEPEATSDRNAAAVYDFYGIPADYLNPSLLHRQEMKMGVGVLSCVNEQECRRAVSKIREYATTAPDARHINEILTIGGLGDKHTHDRQAIDFCELVSKAAPAKFVETPICIDAYGNDEARNRMLRNIDEGKSLTVYFGHGGSRMFGKNTKFFSSANVLRMENRNLSILYAGGCDFTVPDRRRRGMGEEFVLSTDRGMAAAIVSTRTTWSNQNFDLGRRLVNSLLSGWPDREKAPTLGEVYAKAKTRSDYANSLCYILVGDPALRVPTVRDSIALTIPAKASVAEKLKISGTVLNPSGSARSDFNGKAVVKLMRPGVKLLSCDVESGSIADGDSLVVPYSSEKAACFEADVTDGRFELEIVMPPADLQPGEKMPVYVSAIDPSTRFGAVGYSEIILGNPSETSGAASSKDDDAPAVILACDGGARMLLVEASDDCGIPLSTGAVSAKVDGRYVEAVICQDASEGDVSQSMSAFVPLTGLEEGDHRAEVTVTDAAGNAAVSELEFTLTPSAAPLTLRLEHKAVTDELAFETEGEFTGTLQVTVRDSEGRAVHVGTASSGSYSWNCRDGAGKRLPAGLYSVMVKEAGERARYSEWTHFAIFD